MFRLFFTYVLPLIAPTPLYLFWNGIAAASRPRGQACRAAAAVLRRHAVAGADGAGVSLLVVVLLGFMLFGDAAPPGARYVPPHMDGGKIVPGQSR